MYFKTFDGWNSFCMNKSQIMQWTELVSILRCTFHTTKNYKNELPMYLNARITITPMEITDTLENIEDPVNCNKKKIINEKMYTEHLQFVHTVTK